VHANFNLDYHELDFNPRDYWVDPSVPRETQDFLMPKSEFLVFDPSKVTMDRVRLER
jgi:hypothetical protein